MLPVSSYMVVEQLEGHGLVDIGVVIPRLGDDSEGEARPKMQCPQIQVGAADATTDRQAARQFPRARAEVLRLNPVARSSDHAHIAPRRPEKPVENAWLAVHIRAAQSANLAASRTLRSSNRLATARDNGITSGSGTGTGSMKGHDLSPPNHFTQSRSNVPFSFNCSNASLTGLRRGLSEGKRIP